MTTSATQDLLSEVWAIKDALSARHGHDLKSTCRAFYAEQAQHPNDFVNLGAVPVKDQQPPPMAGAEDEARRREMERTQSEMDVGRKFSHEQVRAMHEALNAAGA